MPPEPCFLNPPDEPCLLLPQLRRLRSAAGLAEPRAAAAARPAAPRAPLGPARASNAGAAASPQQGQDKPAAGAPASEAEAGAAAPGAEAEAGGASEALLQEVVSQTRARFAMEVSLDQDLQVSAHKGQAGRHKGRQLHRGCSQQLASGPASALNCARAPQPASLLTPRGPPAPPARRQAALQRASRAEADLAALDAAAAALRQQGCQLEHSLRAKELEADKLRERLADKVRARACRRRALGGGWCGAARGGGE
jgi:hypothetical protein